MLIIVVVVGIVLPHRFALYDTPGNLQLQPATVTMSVASAPVADGSVPITLTTDHVAVFVTLTTLADGRFSDNAFMMMPSKSVVVDFVPFGSLDMAKLTSSLRVEHLATYL